MPTEVANRRPIADVFRTTAHAATRWCAARGVHPNWISYASMVAAAGAAVSFAVGGTHAGWLLVACVGCVVRLWCNMLDGMVAIESGKTSKLGEIVNELPDRISDVLIFVGVALNATCVSGVGYGAAIAALLVAYVGILGQTVGAPRQFGGLMSKPWRMVVVMVAAVVTALAPLVANDALQSGWRSPLTAGCLVVIAGSVQTIAVRLLRTVRWIREHAG